MFTPFFIVSAALLLISLALSLVWRKAEKVCNVGILVFSCTTLFLAAGILIEHFYADRFAFLHPWFLLLLLVPILLLTARLYAANYFSKPIAYPLTGLLKPAGSLFALLARWAETLLYIASLCLLIVALARPVLVSKSKLPPTQGIDIMMIIDASGSMNNTDFYPNRFAAAQKNAIQFIGKRLNDRIGLTIFAKNATLAAPLSLDHDAIQELVASLYLGIVDSNATAIGDALGVAANHLKNSTAKSKIILLLTDGSNNAGTLDPILAAQAAAAYGIKIYTIATASPPGTNVFSSLEDEIDEGLLMNIAKETGGTFYRAKNELELRNIYDEINELEKTDFTQVAQISRYDIYRPFLLLGLFLLLGGFILGKLIFIKVP